MKPHLKSTAMSTAWTIGLLLALTAGVGRAQTPFVTSGLGSVIPAAGTGDGTWPNTLPSQPAWNWTSGGVPLNACTIDEIRIHGLSHTWIGDLHIVLVSPSDQRTTLVHRPGFDGTNYGNSGDCTGGTYIIVPQGAGGAAIPTTGDWLPGTYEQSYGSGAGQWPSGVGGIFNLGLSSTTAEWKLWKLEIYDWASGDSGSFTGWEIRGRLGLPFEVNGPGGPVPASGWGGGGVWPGTPPPSPQVSLSGYAPPGTAKLWLLDIHGLTHTWCGDLQAVLWNPAHVGITIFHRPGFDGVNSGNSADCTGGTYSFAEPFSGGAGQVPSSGAWPAGFVYEQYFGQGGGEWPSGTLNIHNEPLSRFHGQAGRWSLTLHDWAAGDQGSFSGWTLHGYFLPTGPLHSLACVAGTTSSGCSASINATGSPSLSNAAPCQIQVSGVQGDNNGVVFYGLNGFSAVPFGGGTMCVAPPRERTGVQFSGGGVGTCNGSFALDWDAFRVLNPFALGQPFQVGSTVTLQAWFRDPPSPGGTNLSDAVLLTHVP